MPFWVTTLPFLSVGSSLQSNLAGVATVDVAVVELSDLVLVVSVGELLALAVET